MYCNSEFKMIQDMISKLPAGQCPNFLIFGKTEELREQMGYKLAYAVEQSGKVSFEGRIKKFTILMPYFNDKEETDKFEERLIMSVSIARDCYENFSGIVLVEMEKEWEENGYEPLFMRFVDYVKRHSKICFILLYPGERTSKNASRMFYDLCRVGTWARISSDGLTVDECISHFSSVAQKHNYTVTDKAKTVLKQIINEDENRHLLANEKNIERLVDQLDLEKKLLDKSDATIDDEDIKRCLGTSFFEDKLKIGFNISR